MDADLLYEAFRDLEQAVAAVDDEVAAAALDRSRCLVVMALGGVSGATSASRLHTAGSHITKTLATRDIDEDIAERLREAHQRIIGAQECGRDE